MKSRTMQPAHLRSFPFKLLDIVLAEVPRPQAVRLYDGACRENLCHREKHDARWIAARLIGSPFDARPNLGQPLPQAHHRIFSKRAALSYRSLRSTVLLGESLRTIAICCEPLQPGPSPYESLQSLPYSSLSWCRSRNRRPSSSSRCRAFSPDPADRSPYMFG